MRNSQAFSGKPQERFQSAAAELRDMSREIQRELEATREALRRGAADLPQETAQQAAAMRRAVADQIKALEELSEIVTRSGRAYDVSQPAPVNCRTRRPAGTPPARGTSTCCRTAARSGAPRPEAQRPRPAARPANAKTSDRGGGWISDLLARADSEEPPVSPNAPAKPTATGATVGSDFSRCRADDRSCRRRRRLGPLSPRRDQRLLARIYVGRGPQTFDEIRRRYRLDPEFHATVDRYVQEFERLLAELGQDEASEAVAKTYLLSETGKVYTLLAHAAGKLS